MSTALATFASGASINAATLRGLAVAVETYINEQTLAADRGTNWLDANHVYRPDFYGAPDPHTTLVSGESYFRNRPIGDEARAYFSYYGYKSSYLPVPGMGVSFCLPETLNNATRQYRCNIRASWACYEFGGGDLGSMDDSTVLSANFALMINGTRMLQTVRPVYKGSRTGSVLDVTAFYVRKQHSVAFTVEGTGTGALSVGLNHIALGCAPEPESLDADSNPNSKLIIVRQGNLMVRYWLR